MSSNSDNSYIIQGSDFEISISGLTFKDKKVYKNHDVAAEEYYIRAEDVNAIKKSVNDICYALSEFSDYTEASINEVKDLASTAAERAIELSRDCTTLSRGCRKTEREER